MAVAAVAQTAGAMLIFATLSVAGSLGARWRWPPRAELAALAVLAACGAAIVVAKVVLAPIAIIGQAAWLVSAAIGSTLAAVWSGVALHLSAHAQPPGTSVVDVWCAPIVPRPRWLQAFFVVILPLAAFLLVNRVSMFDWDFMVQKLIAVAVLVAAFALVHSLARSRAGGHARRHPAPAFIVPGLAAVLCATTTIGAARLLPAVEQRPAAALDTYLAADPSLRLARDLTAGRDESSAAFYSYLRANSGIKDDVRPIDISFFKFVTAVSRASARPPHIFLFVIDSLRRDYVSPYNHQVTFTPSIAAFARESVTFDRAFSRYGGTGLSVPAIWAGGMILHKEYVTPFAPMNALAKLLDAHGYRRFITADHITDELFPRSTATVDLDRGVSEMGHTFCGTVGELEQKIAKLAGAGDDPRPIFAHTRPLDLHIGNIWSARAPQGEAYPGFHAVYASRVHRIDACFGQFVDFLRREHLYDDSVIILTADHGDSLGEGLRWGHGFTVFPEVLRIPLIVHLPPALAGAFEADVERVSFTVDITPTLYALLGNAPITREPEYGAPLFARSRADLTDRQHAAFLVASSYGSVYGLLTDNGTHLYIADAINGREYAFDLTRQAAANGGDGDVRIGLTDAQRAAARQAISEQVAALAAEYHYAPGVSPTGQ
jgi:hypothetical protein